MGEPKLTYKESRQKNLTTMKLKNRTRFISQSWGFVKQKYRHCWTL